MGDNPFEEAVVGKDWGRAYEQMSEVNFSFLTHATRTNRLPETFRTVLNNADDSPLCIQFLQSMIDNGGINVDAAIEVNSYVVESILPLNILARRGKLETLKLLLANGADVNAEDGHHDCPLKVAICYNNLDIVLYLLTRVEGLDTSPRDRYNNTLLHTFCNARWPEEQPECLLLDCLSALCQKEPSLVHTPNCGGFLPIHFAAVNECAPVLELLYETFGSSIDSPDARGMTPFQHVMRDSLAIDDDRFVEIAEWFISKGISVNTGKRLRTENGDSDTVVIRDVAAASVEVDGGPQGSALLHLAEKAVSLQLLVDNGATVIADDICSFCGRWNVSKVRIVQILLDAGADIEGIIDEHGLVKAEGPPANRDEFPFSLLERRRCQAASGDTPSIVDVLVAEGATIDLARKRIV